MFSANLDMTTIMLVIILIFLFRKFVMKLLDNWTNAIADYSTAVELHAGRVLAETRKEAEDELLSGKTATTMSTEEILKALREGKK